MCRLIVPPRVGRDLLNQEITRKMPSQELEIGSHQHRLNRQTIHQGRPNRPTRSSQSTQWENETLVLVHLIKGYKGLNISKRKSATERNIIKAMKQTARDIYETIEHLNPTQSVSLHQQVTLSTSDSMTLINLNNRSDQRAIFRLRLFVLPYIQIRHQDRAVCPHCDKLFDIYTVHYIAVCPASHVSCSKFIIDVPIHMYNINSTPLPLEILRRQGARRHKELTQLIHKFPPAS